VKCSEPRVSAFKALFRSIGVSDDLLVLSVHESDETTVLVEISAVVDEISALRVVKRFTNLLFETAVFNAFKLGDAVSRNVFKLPNRVAFLNPKLKPMTFITHFDIGLLPDKSFETTFASESLLVLPSLATAFDLRGMAGWTMFF